ncbi:MAG: DNA mismatch repair protein MutT [Mycoplasmoidaceae bacterium]
MNKLLYKNKYVSLYETKQGFVYAQRRGINSTAILCFKKVKGNYYFLIRYQPLPVVNTVPHLKWDDLYACPITGSIEENQSPLDNALSEIYEEANLKVSKKNLIAGSYCVSSTQMNETVFNFLFDVTGIKPINKKQGDGSIFENISLNKWISYQQLKKIVLNSKGQIYLSSLLTCLDLFETYYGKIKNKH